MLRHFIQLCPSFENLKYMCNFVLHCEKLVEVSFAREKGFLKQPLVSQDFC